MRNAVRSGKFDPRDRATRRRRKRRSTEEPTEDTREIVTGWCLDHIDTPSSPLALAQFDWRGFIDQTHHLGIPPGERLRALAIYLEDSAADSGTIQGWQALMRLYDAALAFSPLDPDMMSSALATTKGCAENGATAKIKTRLFEEARHIGREAEARFPKDAWTRYAIGKLEYAANQTEAALVRFNQALELKDDLGWAQLFRAHCLHDLERWSQAADAYDAVDKSLFDGVWAYVHDNIKANGAWCHYRAGHVEEARARFIEILDRFEKHPAGIDDAPWNHFHEAMSGPLREDLHDRFIAMAPSWLREQFERWDAQDAGAQSI